MRYLYILVAWCNPELYLYILVAWCNPELYLIYIVVATAERGWWNVEKEGTRKGG